MSFSANNSRNQYVIQQMIHVICIAKFYNSVEFVVFDFDWFIFNLWENGITFPDVSAKKCKYYLLLVDVLFLSYAWQKY